MFVSFTVFPHVVKEFQLRHACTDYDSSVNKKVRSMLDKYSSNLLYFTLLYSTLPYFTQLPYFTLSYPTVLYWGEIRADVDYLTCAWIALYKFQSLSE